MPSRRQRSAFSYLRTLLEQAKRAGDHATWGAIDGILMFATTGRASARAYWYIHDLTPREARTFVQRVKAAAENPSTQAACDAARTVSAEPADRAHEAREAARQARLAEEARP